MGASTFINKEIESVIFQTMRIITAQQHISPAVYVNVSRGAAYPVQWMRLKLICCGLVLKRMGMLGAGVRKMKALTVQMEE